MARPCAGGPFVVQRWLLPAALRVRRGRAAGVVRRAGDRARVEGRVRRPRQHRGLVGSGGGAVAKGRAHRVPPRLGAGRRGLRRAPGCRVGAGRDRPTPRARIRPVEADRRERLRRGGGVTVWPRLPRLTARGGRDGLVEGAGAAGPGRRLPAGRARCRRAGTGRRGQVVGAGRPDRVLRRAARGAGAGPGRPGRRDRRGQRDRAARALPLRLRRAGQPCRHHADGGPPRPDAHLCHDRPRGQQAGATRG